MSEIYNEMRHKFRELYFSEVQSKLEEYNKFRKANVPRLVLLYIMGGSLVLVLATWQLKVNDSPMVITTISFIIFILSLVLFSFVSKKMNNPLYLDSELYLKNDLMKKFLSIFLEDVKWEKASNENTKVSIDKYKQLCIFGACPAMHIDDTLQGKYQGVNISIYEADTGIFGLLKNPDIMYNLIFFLARFGGFLIMIGMILGFFAVIGLLIGTLSLCFKLYDSIGYAGFPLGVTLVLLGILFLFKGVARLFKTFRGVIIEIDMNKNFEGQTFFINKNAKICRLFVDKKKFEQVNLEASDFSNKNYIYSNNQVEARYLLTTAFMDRIANLKFVFNASYVRGCFKDNKLTLAINTGKDMFAMGSNFKDTNSNTFETLYNELISVLQVIDLLKLNKYLGL